jgi:hypothetical protein
MIGNVVRTAGELDPVSRTLLTELEIPNRDGALFAGMYAQVKFSLNEANAPIIIPDNAFIFRTKGTQVAIVHEQNRIHWQTIQVGRDFGTQIEVLSGLEPNARVVTNPTDDLREGGHRQVAARSLSAGEVKGPSMAPSLEQPNTRRRSKSLSCPWGGTRSGDKLRPTACPGPITLYKKFTVSRNVTGAPATARSKGKYEDDSSIDSA